MKRTSLFLSALWLICQVSGQQLVTGNADPIGLENSAWSPMLVEGGPDHFFLVSGSYLSAVDHPLLNEVYNDYMNLFFIKYDREGKPVASNHIKGAYHATGAFSHGGGLTLVASASDNVDAGGRQIPVNLAYNLEFIASYDRDCKLQDIVGIWNLKDLQSAYSMAAMNKADGSVFIFGSRDDVAEVAGLGTIGDQWPDRYIYVIKYNGDLQPQWAYTAGFDQGETGFGNYSELRVIPDRKGGVVVTGGYESSGRRPVFGNDTLPQIPDGMGLFAVSIDAGGGQSWIQNGSMKGYGIGTYIHEGMSLKNGDILLAGVTTTGYFELGDAVFAFEKGLDYANQFVYRIRQDGSVVWSAPFNNMGRSETQEKKSALVPEGVASDEFQDQIFFDARLWNEKILYLTGTFMNNDFTVAGRRLTKRYPEGVFIASLDVASGEEIWGFGMSSDWIGLNGFDADESGNISLMGHTGDRLDCEGFGPDSVPDRDLVFHLGLDFNGKPLWYTHAFLASNSYGLHGADLEVLPGGQVFSSIYTSRSDQIIVGGDPILSVPTYASWVVSLVPSMELGGHVWKGTGEPVFPGYVRAFKSSAAGRYPLVDSTDLDESGAFLFTGLYPGKYTFHAIPGPEGPLSIPTYLGDAARWKEARFIDIEPDTRAGFLDIQVNEIPVMGPDEGQGTMMGNVSYEDEEVLKGTMGRPVKKASVILIEKSTKKSDGDGVVAYGETDDLGSFIFENVPDGDYILIIEIAGLEMIETHEVRIEGNKIVSGLDYTVGSDGIYTWGGVGIEKNTPGQLRIFPNPGKGLIFLELPGNGTCHAEIYGSDGRLVRRQTFSPGAESGIVDISDREPGIYLVRLVEPGKISVTRYILR